MRMCYLEALEVMIALGLRVENDQQIPKGSHYYDRELSLIGFCYTDVDIDDYRLTIKEWLEVAAAKKIKEWYIYKQEPKPKKEKWTLWQKDCGIQKPTEYRDVHVEYKYPNSEWLPLDEEQEPFTSASVYRYKL